MWKAEAQPEVRKSMLSPGSWMKPAEREELNRSCEDDRSLDDLHG